MVIARDGRVLVGGNEDWERLDSYMWASAATPTAHGAAYLGYEIRGEWGHPYTFWYEFQGMNDAGLYFDSFGAPCVTPTTTLRNPDRGYQLMVTAMRTCTTVEEAVALFEGSNLRFMSCQQFLFVDRSGHAAVVEGDTTVWMEGSTFAVTNFYLSNPHLGNWPCWRYDRVTSMLAADSTPSVDRIGDLLRAASHPGTMYSVVADLTGATMRVSYAHDFTRWATLDVATLCQSGSARVSIEDLVSAGE